MSILSTIKQSLALKMSFTLAIPMVLLTLVAAIFITKRQADVLEEMTFDKATTAAKLGAKYYGEALEHAVDTGVLPIQDLFDYDYKLVPGFDWGDKPKYHTKYDFYTDHAVLRFQDAFLDNPDFVFAIGEDINGYLPTHNTKYQKPITGDPAVDNLGNRSKRIFDDEVGLKAAKNLEPVLVQDYKRDTGERMWDVSAPIYVKGKHWGAFRLAVSMERIAHRTSELLGFLGLTFLAFIALTSGLLVYLIRRAMAPVERLNVSARKMSLGEELDTPIRPETEDEVGRLARSIERLRVSMKAAMQRLGE